MAKSKKREPLALLHNLESTGESLKEAGSKAAKDAAKSAAPKVESGLKQLGDLVDAGIKVAEEAADRVRPQVEDAAEKFRDDVLPKLTERAGGAAASAGQAIAAWDSPDALDALATRLTGDKKAVRKAQKALAKASRELRKSTERKSSKTAVLWIGAIAVIGAAGAAAYVWKRSQPVEDPWSTPLNNRPADARPVSPGPEKGEDVPAKPADAPQ